MKIVTRSNALGALLSAVAIYGQKLGAYGDWWAYDNLMHFISGAALGSFIATDDSPLIQDLLFVTGIGIAWEFFEFDQNISPWDTDDVDAAANDTFTDMLLVIVGATATALQAKKEPRRNA